MSEKYNPDFKFSLEKKYIKLFLLFFLNYLFIKQL